MLHRGAQSFATEILWHLSSFLQLTKPHSQIGRDMRLCLSTQPDRLRCSHHTCCHLLCASETSCLENKLEQLTYPELVVNVLKSNREHVPHALMSRACHGERQGWKQQGMEGKKRRWEGGMSSPVSYRKKASTSEYQQHPDRSLSLYLYLLCWVKCAVLRIPATTATDSAVGQLHDLHSSFIVSQ